MNEREELRNGIGCLGLWKNEDKIETSGKSVNNAVRDTVCDRDLIPACPKARRRATYLLQSLGLADIFPRSLSTPTGLAIRRRLSVSP